MVKMKLPAKPPHSGVKAVIYPVAFGVLIIALWQGGILHRLLNTSAVILPVPTKIIDIINDNGTAIWQNTKITLSVILPGLIIGSVIGYILSVLACFSPRFGGTGLTVIAAVSAVPIVALSAVMLQWTRRVSPDVSVRSYVMKLLIVIIVSIASMTLNAYRGLTELPPFSLDLMKSYAVKKLTVLFKLRAPNSIPFVFTSLKVSVPASVMAAAVVHYFLLSHAENGSTRAAASFSNDNKSENERKRTTICFNFKAEFFKKPFIMMLFVTMLNGTVKHAVAYWIPTYFSKNLSIGERAASVISAMIPVIGIGTGFFAVLLYKLIKSDFKTLILLFSASAVSFLLVTVGGKTVWLPVVGMLLSNAAMGTANSVIFNMYCLRFRETGHVSSVSGLLDSACYAASAAANMLFTVVISAAGFGSAVWVWFSLSALGVAAAFFADRAYSG